MEICTFFIFRPKLCEQNAIGRHRSITDSFQEHPCAKSYATFSIDKLLNPATKKEIDKENVDLFNRIKGEFEKLDIRRALPSLFSVLAHSSTPCGHNGNLIWYKKRYLLADISRLRLVHKRKIRYR